MAKRKQLHYGTKLNRLSVSDRASKTARPWNHPEAVKASQAYGVPFASHNQVALYENRLESIGSLEPHERMTCIQCGRYNSECGCTEEWTANDN